MEALNCVSTPTKMFKTHLMKIYMWVSLSFFFRLKKERCHLGSSISINFPVTHTWPLMCFFRLSASFQNTCRFHLSYTSSWATVTGKIKTSHHLSGTCEKKYFRQGTCIALGEYNRIQLPVFENVFMHVAYFDKNQLVTPLFSFKVLVWV